MPTRLAYQFEQSVRDPDLLNLRSEIALLDARMADVLESASNGEAGELWKKLKDALKEYDHPKGATEPARELAKSEALANIRWLIEEGYQDYLSWIEIRQLALERKQLVDGERVRLKDMQQLMSVERGAMLIGALTASVRKHVTDPGILASIAADLRGIVNTGPGERDFATG